MFGNYAGMANSNQQGAAAQRARIKIPPFAFLLTASVGVIGSNSLTLGPIAPEVARGLGASVPAVMSASAAFGLGTAASAIFLGGLVDRHGARRMLALALLTLACGLAVSAIAPILPLLATAQFVAGMASGVALPAIYTLAAAVAPEGRESETIGVVLTGWTLSILAGVSLSAVISDIAGWRAVYVTITMATLAACAAVHLARIDDSPQGGSGQSPLSALRVRGVIPLLAGCMAFMAGFYGVYAYIGDHLHATLGLPLSANGLIAVSYGLGFGGAALLDRVIDRFGAGRLLAPLFLAVAIVFIVMAVVSSSYVGMLAVVFPWGLANHLGLNVLILRLTALDPARRGAIMGLNSGVTYLALFAGTVGFGRIYEAAGFAALPLAAFGLMLAGAFFAAVSPRH